MRKEKARRLTRNPRNTGRVSLQHPAGGVCYKKPDKKGACRRDTRHSGGFRKFYVIFVMSGYVLLLHHREGRLG